MTALRHLALGGALLSVVAVACADERGRPTGRPPRLIVGGGGGAGGGEFAPEQCSLELTCGGELREVRLDVPNVYFVLDASGSMGDLDGSGDSRFDLVRSAALTMVRQLGPLINVGAALFPEGNLDVDACSTGREVMSVRPGDREGSTSTYDALRILTNVEPLGGTPVAATLDALAPTLTALEGQTVVLLLTDGGPNCNDDTSCDVDACIPNIEGGCPPEENCCAADHESGGPHLCLDADPTRAAVAALRAEGVETYVIGIPGSEAYGPLLDDLALAGGTARQDASTLYHRVDDLAALADVFAAIAAENISCEIPLDPLPEEPDLTNVYLDCDQVPSDPVDGWTFGFEGDTVILGGQACGELKAGEVEAVRVLYGCPTVVK